MLKNTLRNSPSFQYSLISLQLGMMMQRRKALKVATKPLNKLISY